MSVSIGNLLRSWQVWGIPALIAVLAPWHGVLTEFRLISEYWEPEINVLCSGLGALGAMYTFAFLHDEPRKIHRRWAKRLAFLFVASFLLTLGFSVTIGNAWVPRPPWQHFVWAVWILSYIVVFVTSGALLIALLLSGTKKQRNTRSH